jgi:hypothetical protein
MALLQQRRNDSLSDYAAGASDEHVHGIAGELRPDGLTAERVAPDAIALQTECLPDRS